MYTNRPGCTVYEKTIQNRAPTYIRHEVGAIYWEEDMEQADGSNRAPKNVAFISIPAASTNYSPKIGDRIVGTVIDDEQPPPTAMTVMKASNLRYGSPLVQHWEVTAE